MNSSTVDSDGLPSFGVYENAITDLSFNIGGYSGTLGSTSLRRILVVNDDGAGTDQIIIQATFAGNTVNSFNPFFFELILLDFTGSAFTSDALPTSPPNLGSFSTDQFDIQFRDATFTRGGGAFGQVNSITVLTMPEPSSRCCSGSDW